VRIFLDTNVLASSVATRGLCSELFEEIFDAHELLICEAVLEELRRVLNEKFRLPATVIKGFLDLLRSEAEVIPASEGPPISFQDPDDVTILACVVAGRADVFVTGDKALLGLGEIHSVPILSPRQLWQRLAGVGER